MYVTLPGETGKIFTIEKLEPADSMQKESGSMKNKRDYIQTFLHVGLCICTITV